MLFGKAELAVHQNSVSEKQANTADPLEEKAKNIAPNSGGIVLIS